MTCSGRQPDGENAGRVRLPALTEGVTVAKFYFKNEDATGPVTGRFVEAVDACGHVFVHVSTDDPNLEKNYVFRLDDVEDYGVGPVNQAPKALEDEEDPEDSF